ncbi:MAG TPA: hypothetical protein VHD87_00040, partial [Acidimicrobiales bacterium]|nr:hypothetical protein [Acidimicrobiales bacterium]
MNEFLVSGLRKLVEKTAGEFDPALLSPLGAARAIEEWAAIEKLACAQKLLTAARAEDVGLDAEGIVADSSGVPTGAARKQTKAARKAKGKTRDAFDRGKLSPTQAGAIADAVATNPDAEDSLLELAERASTTELLNECERIQREASDDSSLAARQHAARFVRTWKDRLGMTRGSFALEPLLGAKLVAELEARAQRFFREQARRGATPDTLEHRLADALTGMVGDLGGPKRGPRTVVRLIATKEAVERGYLLPGEKCETA